MFYLCGCCRPQDLGVRLLILTRWFTFAAPPKCGCLWFREILRVSGIAVFGETPIEVVDGFELQKYRDSFRHHVPGSLPSVTIRRDPAKWLKSYLHHFEGKKMAIPALDYFMTLDRKLNLADVEKMFNCYKSTLTIGLDYDPGGQVCNIFSELDIPHDPEAILALKPVNVTEFP